MSKNTRRIALAFCVSATGFAATFGWYNLTETSGVSSVSSKEIARLVSTTNEVQKKSVKRIIWQPASENETLRVGEAIRTSSDSEARIEFLYSDTAIDLEPDSAIVLEENDGQLALDFIRGNIFVKSNSNAGDSGSKTVQSNGSMNSIKLKSGDKEIALGQSEVSLGRSAAGELDLQVIAGQVQGEQRQDKNLLKITNFRSDVPIYLNLEKNERVEFEFEATSKGYRVFVEAGRSRSRIQPVPDAVADGASGKVNAQLALGRNYFRLVAKPTDPKLPTLTSPVLKTMVLSKVAPQPLYPENKSLVSVSKDRPEVKFVWSNPAGYKQLIIEISQSPDLKKDRVTEYIEKSNEFLFATTKPGQLYWRVSGVLVGSKEVVSSSIQSFTATINDKLDAPILISPKPNERFQHEIIEREGLTFSWKPNRQAKQYKVSVYEKQDAGTKRSIASQKPIFAKEVQLPYSKVESLNPGQYLWSVEAIDDQGGASKSSESRDFTVHKLPKIEWAENKNEYYYLSLKPTLPLSWTAPGIQLNYWTLRVRNSADSKLVFNKKTRDSAMEIPLPTDGTYQAEVEAFDSKNQIIAKSDYRIVKVVAAPLLPPPKFADNTPQELKANKDGALEFRWNQVEGAEKYMALLTSNDGRIKKELNFNSIEGSLDNLLPGQYSISLKSIDKHGRVGPAGESRMVNVPNKSNLRAPKLKGVKFK